MKNFKIELIEIGRHKHNQIIEIALAGYRVAEQFALNEVAKHLLSNEIELAPQEGYYSVIVGGFRPVGNVKIQEQ